VLDESPSTLEALIAELRRLPGIGARSAQRIAQHLVRGPREDGLRLALRIEEALRHVAPCSVCHDLAESDPCPICSDPDRSASCASTSSATGW
jgi:recombination protein RecR